MNNEISLAEVNTI